MKKCPKCGYVNKLADNNATSSSECPVCGILYKKYEEYLSKKKAHKKTKNKQDKGIHKLSLDRLLSGLRNSLIIKAFIKYKNTLASLLYILWIMGCGYWLYTFKKISVTPQKRFFFFTPAIISSRESLTILFVGIFVAIFTGIVVLFLCKFFYNMICKEIMLIFPKEVRSFIAPVALLIILCFSFVFIESLKIGGCAAYYNINEIVTAAKNHTLEIENPALHKPFESKEEQEE
ncbi:MAG: hypothetical protein ACMUIP_06180 [bacterium]